MKKSTMPSMAALLGLLAIAGYQNRDKLGDILGSLTGGGPADPNSPAPSGGLLGNIMKGVSDMASGAGLGPVDANSGLKGVLDSFRNAGASDAADSWVSTGPNQPVSNEQTEKALGGDLIDMLVKQTGLSREELVARLSQVLPEAVDKMTPGGRVPAA
jgi:uncharacterized protein YidB (DUF937 family)